MHEVTTPADVPAVRGDEDIKEGLKGTVRDQENAVTRAYQRFARPLAAFIRERAAPTLDSDEVATAVNETFCGLARYAAAGKFDSSGALSTLLFEIARRKATDLLRKKTCQKRRVEDTSEFASSVDEGELGHGKCSDDEIALHVTQRLVLAPEIRELWRTAADEAQANEVIRQFRLWIGGLSKLQRRVAELMVRHFGSASDSEMCDELKAEGVQATPASVKSARSEIVRKFKSLLEKQKGPHQS
jgi:DNA-directed RNA polymerase specialized sigma24 family protein